MRKKYSGIPRSTGKLPPNRKLDRERYQGMKVCVRMTTAPATAPPWTNVLPKFSVQQQRRLLCRTAQFQTTFRFRRFRPRLWLGLGLDRLELRALHPRRHHARSHFGTRIVDRTGPVGMTRPRSRDRTRHQHLRSTLMMEIAIRKAHPGHRAAKAHLGSLVEIETGLERHAAQRCTDRLSADQQRVAGKTDMPDRAGAGELHG